MTSEITYPKVVSARALSGKRVLVTFASQVAKVYDCTPLIAQEAFTPLANDALFRNVHADPNGYGIVWNDEIDLAESELWINGVEADQDTVADVDWPRQS